MAEKKLKPKQKRFVDEYIKNKGNGSDAARKAGYSKKCAGEIARQNLKKVDISAAIDKKLSKIQEIAPPDWIAQMLKDTAQACFDGKAHDRGLVNASGVVSSLSEINKMAGNYAPVKSENKMEVSHDLQQGQEVAARYLREH